MASAPDGKVPRRRRSATTAAGTGGPAPDDAPVCTQVDASYEFEQDVAVVGWLVVGQACPVDRGDLRLSVNGRIGASAGIRTDRTVTAGDLAFAVEPKREASTARLYADADRRFGLDGALRVRDALGIGTAPTDDPAATAGLVVRGDATSTGRSLQIWQDSDGHGRAAVDGVGRFGVGTTAPAASLSVHGAFLVKLSGTVKGYDNSMTLTGVDTRFEKELGVGSMISIPSLQPPPTTFQVVSIKDDTELTLDRRPRISFDGRDAFTDGPLLSIANGAGSEVFHLDSDGSLTLAGGATTIAANGVVTAPQFVGQGAVVSGMIVMWTGATTAVPTGWALCNGENGTPDLRSRFLVGAGSDYEPMESGEADVHTHTIAIPANTATSATAGAHNHGMPSQWYGRWTGSEKEKTYTLLDVAGVVNLSGVRTTSDAQHSHAVPLSHAPFASNQSGGQNRPKWYALAYIMKL